MTTICSESATPAPEEREYVLGTGADELARLGLQHQLWSKTAHELWERARFKPGMRILDAGCGPGYATFDLAHLVGPEGAVIGVDESSRFIQHVNEQARLRNLTQIEVHQGNVLDLKALLRSQPQFDAAYMRWVLCFLSEPERVIHDIAALLAPGGRIAIQDYFNYRSMTLAPRRPAYERVVQAADASWRAHGGNPDVMGDMPRIVREAGLELVHFGVNQRLARPGEMMWAWPDSFWHGYVPKLIEAGNLTREEAGAFFTEWQEVSSNPDTVLVLPAVYDIIAVKK